MQKSIFALVKKYASKNTKTLRSSIHTRRFIKRNLVGLESYFKKAGSWKKEKPVNIYHASIQRTGSQWIRKIFSDARIKSSTNMMVFPQHEYDIHQHRLAFPKYSIIPGLYVRYEQYQRIQKPSKHKTVYIIRDPRNVVLSWYKAMVKKHRPTNESVQYYRNLFDGLSKQKGLIAAIKAYRIKLEFMRDWVLNSKDDGDLKIFKFEKFTDDPKSFLSSLMAHCNLDVPKKTIKKVVSDYSKSKLRKRSDYASSASSGDYSRKKTDWRNEFNEEVLDYFREITGSLVEQLGYE